MNANPDCDVVDVLIAGGGVAALETMMALRSYADDRVRITLLAPDGEFRYRPMAVAEPFTIAGARHLPLQAVAADFDAELLTGSLAAVDADARVAVTRDGHEIAYDVLVVACGTRPRPPFEGVLTIDDRSLGSTFRGLVQDVEQGYAGKIAFVAPAQAFWPLPLYELALLTAHRAYDMNVPVEISVVTPESAPLGLFGAGISHELSRLLHDAGIAFHGSSFAGFADGELTLRPSGARLRPDRVVALPLLDGPEIAGLPTDPHGFIPVTDFGEVRGTDGIYAAGDVTSFTIKHGGLAAQEADIVAAVIAARAGVAIEPQPLHPAIRGILLTGGRPRYVEAELAGQGFTSTVSDICPWDPPTKIVARHLGPYLARGDRDAARR